MIDKEEDIDKCGRSCCWRLLMVFGFSDAFCRIVATDDGLEISINDGEDMVVVVAVVMDNLLL